MQIRLRECDTSSMNGMVTISPVYRLIKRILDIVLSLFGMVITSPVLLIVCLLVKIESNGKAIYKQNRVGLNNKEFDIYKVRSMKDNAEVNGAQWAEKNDPRVTKIGAFIRKTRIDELPQLLNIFKGDMTLIGPRPEREVFYLEFEKEIDNFRDRLLVKPGLTGYAQVNGGYELGPKEKLELDLYYIKKESFLLDLNIVFKTFRVVITGEGAR